MTHGRNLPNGTLSLFDLVLAMCCVSFCFVFILKVVGELSGPHIAQLQVHVPSVLFPNYFPVHQVLHGSLTMRHISAPRCRTLRFLSKARQGVYGVKNECSAIEVCLKLIVAEDGRPPLPGSL